MLTESCSPNDGPGVNGSPPGSPGDGSREEEEAEVMALRRRSSVAKIEKFLVFLNFFILTVSFQRQKTYLFHCFVPQGTGYGGTNQEDPVKEIHINGSPRIHREENSGMAR